MAQSKELVTVTDGNASYPPNFVELDGRRSGNHYYQLVCHLGTDTLMLIGVEDGGDVRSVAVEAGEGNEALAHPEIPEYLGGKGAVYGRAILGLVVEYDQIQK